MKCKNCNSKLKKVQVSVEGADSKAVSYQCADCGYFKFEPDSSAKVIAEIKAKESPLKIKQKIIKISKDRLGMYFSRDIVRSLNLTPGKEVYVSIPDRNHIVLGID